MAIFLLLLVFLALFVNRLFSELLEYLHIERHLAAKTGTNLAVSDLMGSFSRRYLCRVLLFPYCLFFQ